MKKTISLTFLIGLLTLTSFSALADYKTTKESCIQGHIRGTTTVFQHGSHVLTCLKVSTLGTQYKTNDDTCISGYLKGIRKIPSGTFGKGFVFTCIKESTLGDTYKTSEACGERFITGRRKKVPQSGTFKIIKTCLKLNTLGDEYKTSLKECLEGYHPTDLREYSIYSNHSNYLVCSKN